MLVVCVVTDGVWWGCLHLEGCRSLPSAEGVFHRSAHTARMVAAIVMLADLTLDWHLTLYVGVGLAQRQ